MEEYALVFGFPVKLGICDLPDFYDQTNDSITELHEDDIIDITPLWDELYAERYEDEEPECEYEYQYEWNDLKLKDCPFQLISSGYNCYVYYMLSMKIIRGYGETITEVYPEELKIHQDEIERAMRWLHANNIDTKNKKPKWYLCSLEQIERY